MQQKHRIYLAGPIFGRSKSDVRSWREEAAARLNFLGAEPLDPCRRDYTGIEHVDDNPAKIVAEDLAEIDGCSAIIAMVDAPSAGTSMEIFYAAHVRKIPVIAIVPDSIAVSPWISHHAEVIKWVADDLGMGRSLDGRAARSAAIGHACARALSAIADDVLRAKIAELERFIATQSATIEELRETCNILCNDVDDEQQRRSDEVRAYSVQATDLRKSIATLQALAEQRASKIDELELIISTQSATIKELRDSCERRRGEVDEMQNRIDAYLRGTK